MSGALAVTVTCSYCNGSFEGLRSDARFCSGDCKVRHHRATRPTYNIPSWRIVAYSEERESRSKRGLLSRQELDRLDLAARVGAGLEPVLTEEDHAVTRRILAQIRSEPVPTLSAPPVEIDPWMRE